MNMVMFDTCHWAHLLTLLLAGPNPPVNLRLVTRSATSLDVAWDSAQGAGDVDLYLVSHFPAVGITPSPLAVRVASPRQVKFENLLPDSNYVVTVEAVSGDVATSQKSEEVSATFTTRKNLYFVSIRPIKYVSTLEKRRELYSFSEM